MLFVYALTSVVAGVWIMRMVSEGKLIYKHTILEIPLFLFLISQIVSTIFSIDPHTSFWGYYSRSNGGLLSTISYLILYFAFVSNFQKEDIFKFLRVLVFAGALVALYALPEHFGVSPSCIILTHDVSVSCWVQDVQARVFGTLGQPNWLAAYLAMTIFPAIFLLIKAESFKWRLAYFLSLVVMYLSFTFTYSRGATLGLIAGFGLFFLSLIYKYFRQKSSMLPLKLSGLVLIIFIGINLLFGSALSDYRILQDPSVPLRPDITAGAKLPSGTQLENGGTESGQIRLIVWKGAIEVFKAHPLIGSGVETFAYSYYLYRPVEHNLVSEWDFLYNKAHNEYLNYLATTGLFGFLTYISIILTFLIWGVWRLIFSRNSKDNSAYLLEASLLAGYLSFLIQNFFLFSVVTGAIFFYLYPGFGFLYAESEKELSGKNFFAQLFAKIFGPLKKQPLVKKIIQALVVILILLSLNTLYSLWEGDTNYKKGSDYNDVGNPGRAYNYLIEAVRHNRKEPLYLSELGNAASSASLALASEDATTSSELKSDAETFTEAGLEISPVNTTVLRTAVRTYFQLSLIDESFKQKTLDVLNRAIALSPTDPKLLLNKAVILGQFGKQNEAIEALQKAIELKPNYREALLALGSEYNKVGEKDKAKKQADIVLKMIPNDPDALKLQDEIKQ